MFKLLEKEDLEAAIGEVDKSPTILRTPLLQAAGKEEEGRKWDLFADASGKSAWETPPGMDFFLKMESMQGLGSFKLRGIIPQIMAKCKGLNGKMKFVSCTAGNYGISLASVASKLGWEGVILMADTPFIDGNRERTIKGYPGMTVERVPEQNLLKRAEEYEDDGYVNMSAYDDRNLIAGYSSIAKEILDEVPDVDVVIMGCGGGGLLAGVAAGLKTLSPRGEAISVYGVEPESQDKLSRSLKAGKPVSESTGYSVAVGLSAPSIGIVPFHHVKSYASSIIIVSDDDLRKAVSVSFERAKLVIEPAGVAGIAAILSGKLAAQTGMDLRGKKVVAIVSGGNVTPAELVRLCQQEKTE